jgi:hypothetical protein
MADAGPIVAIVGSARKEITGDREAAARKACQELGKELGRAGWRIAVYSADPRFIERDVVAGYGEALKEANPKKIPDNGRQPIECSYPRGVDVAFPEREAWGPYFRDVIDSSTDWEVSFYSSVTKVGGVLLLGGANSALIAGHVGLSCGLPTVAVAEFGGSAQKVWGHLISKPALIEEEDRQVMARWTSDSAKQCIKSLSKQYDRLVAKKAEGQKQVAEWGEKAAYWDQYKADRWVYVRRTLLAACCFLFLLVTFISGLVIEPVDWIYTTVTVLGLCAAGAMGAVARLIWAGTPRPWILAPPILGGLVGFIFSLLYLLPTLHSSASFLTPKVESPPAADAGGAKAGNSVARVKDVPAVRDQYITAIVVAFLAGLAFDSALEQLLRRAQGTTGTVVENAPPSDTGAAAANTGAVQAKGATRGASRSRGNVSPPPGH